jgi:hypothetical protein
LTIISLPSRKYCSIHSTYFNKDFSNCPLCTHPSVADGNPISNQTSLNNFHGKLTVNHGKKRPVTLNRKIYERFHSFRVKFNAEIDFEGINGDFTRLRNNVGFKRIEFPEAVVQVFKKSILVILRKNQELIGLPVKEANERSKQLIRSIVARLPREIKVTDSKLVEVHNAFVNHPIAKRDVKVKVNNETRFISDNSKGNPEFEAVNPIHAINDSECIESDIVSLIDKGLSRDFLASALNDLIKDRYFHAENMRSHVLAIQELSKGISKFNSSLDGLSHLKGNSRVRTSFAHQEVLSRWFN